ncbi:MAG TPA: FtsX-like permease family protein [Micromonosporaceae bacterium]
MFRATLKSLLSRKLRLFLSGLAVLLGVMFVSGSFVLTDTLGRSFDQLFVGIFANTDVQVSAKPKLAQGELENDDRVTATIPASQLATIRAVPGVADATGVVLADGARVIGSNGKVVTSFGPPRFGVDWPSQAPDVELREGRGPTSSDEIAVNALLAKAAGIKVGDQVGVLTLQPKKTFRLVGIFGYPGGKDSVGGTQMVTFTMPVAQELMLGQADVYSTVDVKAAVGVSDDELRDRVAAALGSSYEVKTGAQLTKEATDGFSQALQFFNYILIGFGFVALFVAVFLILNTFSILVAQRTRELALLRAIGAGQGQVIGSVLLEAVVIGLIAAVLGLGAGVGVGALLANVFGSAGGGDLAIAGIGVPASAVISAFVVGVGVTVIAAVIPAVRASRIPPVAAMRDAATTDKPLTKLTVAGAVVLGVGAVALGLGLTDNAGDQALWTILGGVMLAFIGTALLTPLVARPVAGLIGRLFSWSTPGRLGRLNSGRNPRRTAITAAALMVGIALITGINTIITSAKESITQVANAQAKVDLIISGDPGAGGLPTYDPAVIDQAAALSGVRAATSLHQDGAVVNGERTFVGAFSNSAALPSMFSLTANAGDIATVADGQALVDEQTATDKGLRVGSTLTVQLARGEAQTLTISGIYAKSDLMRGYVVPVTLTKYFHSPLPNAGFIQVEPGAPVASIKAQVNDLLKDSPEVNVGDRSEFLAQQTSSADQVLVMIQVLLALAILIAVLGVINTLALSVLERTRELGLLRAVGLSRAQTMRMVTVEAVVISVFGALLGLVVGVGLGAAVVQALHDQGITELALPWAQMVTYLVLAAIVGVVAAVLPAIRAARVNVLQAIAYE